MSDEVDEVPSRIENVEVEKDEEDEVDNSAGGVIGRQVGAWDRWEGRKERDRRSINTGSYDGSSVHLLVVQPFSTTLQTIICMHQTETRGGGGGGSRAFTCSLGCRSTWRDTS